MNYSQYTAIFLNELTVQLMKILFNVFSLRDLFHKPELETSLFIKMIGILTHISSSACSVLLAMLEINLRVNYG